MTLYIDTAQNNLIELGLKDGKVFIAKKKFSCRRAQAEMLLPAIEKLLTSNKLKLSGLDRVEAKNRGGSFTSFTSLRVGVVTANALAYALGIPAAGKKPIYARELEVTAKNKTGNVDKVVDK